MRAFLALPEVTLWMMSSFTFPAAVRFLAPMAVSFVLVAAQAHAATAFSIEKKDISESGGTWSLGMRIGLAKAPQTPRVPMSLYISKTQEFRRLLEDGHNDPVTRATDIRPAKTSIETVDVDFAGAKGDLFKDTNFSYRLSRSAGYVAGIYTVQLKTPEGTNVGSAVTITLRGDNPVEDVRTMNFAAKKEDPAAAKPKTDFAIPQNEVRADGTPPPFISEEARVPTEEENIKVKPRSGCGCDSGKSEPKPAIWLLVPLFAALILRRQRTA